MISPSQRLLNFSTHARDLEFFQDDWSKVRDFLQQWEFDGFELYPVGDYPFERIPPDLIRGIHLRFLVILAPIWREDKDRLLSIFDNWQTVEHFYGGRDAQCIVDLYSRQLELARRLGCAYVVFHPVHCELEYIYNWRFPWKLEETLDLCAEVINAATAKSGYDGLILFENLWWPGSFRLDTPEEYDYLRSRVDYPHCGIVLDTGHLLNKNQNLKSERDAVAELLRAVDQLGETARHIHTIHLTKSLSGDYVRRTQKITEPFNQRQTFWEKLEQSRRHAEKIDQHDPFESPEIAAVIEKIQPAHVVFEYTYKDMAHWEEKIAIQKKALQGCLWKEK